MNRQVWIEMAGQHAVHHTTFIWSYIPLEGGVLSTNIPSDVLLLHISALLQEISVT